jgi:hypothetical protein
MAPAIPGVAEDADAVMQGVSGPITVSLDAMKIEVRKIWENIVQIDHLGGVIGLIILCACDDVLPDMAGASRDAQIHAFGGEPERKGCIVNNSS